jgi:ribosomal-protein-alanine N-acetyltransferase
VPRTIPALTTPRLLLRPFREEDADALYAVLSGEGVLRYFPPSPPPTREVAARMIDRALRHWEEHGFGLWAVESRTTGELMGRCGLQRLPETGETEADVILGVPFWGRGYASEAVAAAVRHGVETLALRQLVGIVHPDHGASRRVLEKAGFTRGERTSYFGMHCIRYVLAPRGTGPGVSPCAG